MVTSHLINRKKNTEWLFCKAVCTKKPTCILLCNCWWYQNFKDLLDSWDKWLYLMIYFKPFLSSQHAVFLVWKCDIFKLVMGPVSHVNSLASAKISVFYFQFLSTFDCNCLNILHGQVKKRKAGTIAERSRALKFCYVLIVVGVPSLTCQGMVFWVGGVWLYSIMLVLHSFLYFTFVFSQYKFKIFKYHRIRKCINNIDLRKLDFLSEEKIV